MPALELPELGRSFIRGYSENALGFPIIAIVRDPNRGDGQTPPATGTAHPETATYPNHKFINVEVLKGDIRVLWIYEILPGPLLTDKQISSDAQGAIATSSKQKLAVGAVDYTPTFKTLAYSDTPIDANTKERQTLEMTDSAFPILTDYDQDPEMQSLITTTFQVVDASAVVAPSAVAGVITRYKHIDKRRSLKIVETYATPASYDEQDFDAATFPALFDYTLYSWSDACGAFSQIRAAFSTMVQNRVHISFGAYAAVSGLTLIPVTLQLGKGVQVHEGVLVDSGSFTYAGACTGVVTFTGSSPDYSTYVGSIQGSEQLVTGSCKLWKAGLYRTMKLYRTML